MMDVFPAWNCRRDRKAVCLQNFERTPGAAKPLEPPPCSRFVKSPHGHSVTCPLHNWVISLETGKARTDGG
jgi:hypothetical protein